MKGKTFVNLLAYISIGLIAVALILKWVFNAVGLSSSVVSAMELIAQVIAYAITAVFAFYHAKSQRKIGWMIAYIIFVIAIIVFFILGF